MTQLKTLKDLKYNNTTNIHVIGDPHASIEQIRQETIKWIKFIDGYGCGKKTRTKIYPIEPKGEAYYEICGTLNIEPKPLCSNCEEFEERWKEEYISDWIKHFFNISEEDLK